YQREPYPQCQRQRMTPCNGLSRYEVELLSRLLYGDLDRWEGVIFLRLVEEGHTWKGSKPFAQRRSHRGWPSWLDPFPQARTDALLLSVWHPRKSRLQELLRTLQS